MSDLIDRQVAIDAFATSTSDGDKVDWCRWVLKQVPSAQLEIIRCKDCKYHGANECIHSFALIVSKDNDFCSYAERRIDE